MRKLIALLFILLITEISCKQNDNESEKIKALEIKIDEMGKKIANVERAIVQIATQQKKIDTLNPGLKEKINARIKRDYESYPREQLKEAEFLYQRGCEKLFTEAGENHFKELIRKYPKMNRSGCAFLYIAQNKIGPEKEKLLKEAFEKYGDCLYSDGVEVGAYARFHLAEYYYNAKQLSKFKELIEYLNKNYPDAIDHKGRKLSEYHWKN